MNIIDGRKYYMNSLKRNTELKKMKIWKTNSFLPVIALSVLSIVFAFLLFLCISLDKNGSRKLYALIIIEVLCIWLLVHFTKLMIKEMQHHKNQIREGVIVKGTINNVFKIIEGFEVEVIYDNKETGQKYIYKQSKHSSYNLNWFKQQVLLHPEIEVLVNKENYEDGIVLLDDYCEKMNLSRSHFDYPKISEIKMNDKVQENLKKVRGELKKETLKVSGRNGALMIIEADIVFYDTETNQTMLFKGHGYAKWSSYIKVKQNKENIMVDVVYDQRTNDNYVVYLEEAMDRL